MVVCEDGAFEETIRKHYGDYLVREVLGTAPTRILELSDTETTRILELSDTETTNPFVIAFPDAGCC